MISLKFLSLLILCLTLLFAHDYSLSHLLGFVFACILLNSVKNTTWVVSQRLRWKLQKQGIKGPKPSIIYGNVPQMQRIQATVAKTKAACGGEFIAHDYTSTLFPYFEQWRKEYGPVYTYSTGDKQHLYVNKPELVKEMNQSNTLDLGKPSYVTKRLAPLLGNGILRSNGQTWVQQRKIVAPEFFMDKVKCMVRLMVDSSQPLLKKWESCTEAEGCVEIRVDDDLRNVSADVIARACFGSSYCKGKEIFSKLRVLQTTISKTGFLFALPNLGLFPTSNKDESRSLEREIESLIWEAVRERKEESKREQSTGGRNLLQIILEGAAKNSSIDMNSTKHFIVDNCKNIYLAGHESTAVAASWCLMLLAQHPDWQSRVREETVLVCPDGNIDAESLSKLKMVTMVIQETMRLYPPAAFVSREALEETQLGHITVPKGVCIWTLIPTLHRDTNIWGPDANVFNPNRFANGISGACKVPQAYVPFGLGPRLCLGRNFAMVQLKIVLSLVISKFCFSLSPRYRHSPTYSMIVVPGDGVQLLVRKCKI